MADDDDSDGVYICHACVGDAFLKDEILHEGHKRECHFCGKTRKAWPLEELAERVQGVIEEHFRITPIDPSEEGLPYEAWVRRGNPVEIVIAEIAELEPEVAKAVRGRLSENSGWDPRDGGEDAFGSDTYYEEGSPNTAGFRESWDFFRREIRTRARFFWTIRAAGPR